MHPDDIELAARTLTEAEPPHDLELRIKQRLDEVTPAANARRWPWVAGLATAAALTIAVSQFRSPEVPEFRSPDAVEVPGSRGPEVPESRSVDVPATPRVIRLPSVRPAMSEAELAWMARRIPALDPIETLTVDHLVLDAIQPDSLLITPLTMTPLAPAPILGEPDPGR
jgi:hypothetical protein